LHGEHEAAAHDLAVEPHRAGAANAVLAADMAARQRQPLAQEIHEILPHVDGLAHLLAVHPQGDGTDFVGHGAAFPRALVDLEAIVTERAFGSMGVQVRRNAGIRGGRSTSMSGRSSPVRLARRRGRPSGTIRSAGLFMINRLLTDMVLVLVSNRGMP